MRINVLFILCLCLVGCRGDSSSLDATMTTDDQYVYYIKEFCSKENVKLRLAETGSKEEEVLEFSTGGMIFTPCPGEKVREAFSNLTEEDVEKHKKEYRERYQPKK